MLQTPLFPVPYGLWTPNLARRWFRMRGPHPQSRVTNQPLGHVTNQKRYISTFTRPMVPKHSWLVTQDEETPLTKSCDASITQSRDKSKTFYVHIHKVHEPKNLVKCWIRMREAHPKSHVTLQLRGHVNNQKRHISSTTGLSRCKGNVCAGQK